MYAADLTIRMAQSFGAKARLLSAPGIVSSKEICDALLQDQQIKETLELGCKADIGLIGLGRPTSSSPVIRAGILTPANWQNWSSRARWAIWVCVLWTLKGEAIHNEINDRIIGLNFEQFKEIKKLVGIAAGPEKFEVVKASLMGNL